MTAAEPSASRALRTGLVHELGALAAVAQRDLTKLLRDRLRLAVSLALPVALILGIGNILQPTVGRVTGLNAVTLAFTGVLAATLFQSAAAGMISLVEDRDTDFSRKLFVTPVSRLTLVAGKMAGETLVALCQGVCIVVFAVVIGVSMTLGQVGALIGPSLACCLLGAAFGLAALAALPNQRSAMQVFEFLILPQYVLAGVLVPLRGLPAWLGALSWAMPLRYAVGLTQAAFYAGTPGYRKVVTVNPFVDVVVMVGLFVALVVGGTLLLNYRERIR
jgi:ABC-2 type transport system permease protein